MNSRKTAAWSFDGRSARDALRVRDALLDRLAAERPLADMDAARIVVTELVGNVVRHAPGGSELRLQLDEEHPIVHVLDSGTGCSSAIACLPLDPLSEAGRGLFIVRALTHRLDLLDRRRGGCHVVAVL
jgi:anti-sigma regulatory factor (Ser/Thr protein kinase)